MTIRDMKKYLEEFGDNEDLEIAFVVIDKKHNIVMPDYNIEDRLFIKDDEIDFPAIILGGIVTDIEDEDILDDSTEFEQ